jgi:hypothetical protein
MKFDLNSDIPLDEYIGSAVALTEDGFSGLMEECVTIQADPIEHLIESSLRTLVSRLEGFYQRPVNQIHKDALKRVLTSYTQIALGERTDRLAHALPPGTGKTQSIVAWLSTAVSLGYFSVYTDTYREGSRGYDTDAHFSVAVAANKIEALCELKRDLVDAGVPEELIGLRHSVESRIILTRFF